MNDRSCEYSRRNANVLLLNGLELLYILGLLHRLDDGDDDEVDDDEVEDDDDDNLLAMKRFLAISDARYSGWLA